MKIEGIPKLNGLLDSLIDEFSLEKILYSLAGMCSDRAASTGTRIVTNDEGLAIQWDLASDEISIIASTVSVQIVSGDTKLLERVRG